MILHLEKAGLVWAGRKKRVESIKYHHALICSHNSNDLSFASMFKTHSLNSANTYMHMLLTQIQIWLEGVLVSANWKGIVGILISSIEMHFKGLAEEKMVFKLQTVDKRIWTEWMKLKQQEKKNNVNYKLTTITKLHS